MNAYLGALASLTLPEFEERAFWATDRAELQRLLDAARSVSLPSVLARID